MLSGNQPLSWHWTAPGGTIINIFNEISIGDWLRIVLIFSHVVVCAFAITAVLRTDIRIMGGNFCRQGIEQEARQIAWLLAALWITGLAIIYLDTGFSPDILMTKSKLLLKLLCVLMLSLNGWVLHYVSFPVLTRDSETLTRTESVLLCVTGALSTSHWLLAAFIGMSAPLGQLPFNTLLSTYGVFVCSILLLSITFVPVVRQIKVGFIPGYIERRRAVDIHPKT